MVFKNHFVQVTTCCASSYSLITEMRPNSKEQLKNNIVSKVISDKRENKNRPESFIHYLKRNSYYILRIGKITYSTYGLLYVYEEETSDKRELPYSWDELAFNT